MTPLAVISALVTALCIGYYFGRGANSTPSTWKKRATRVALMRLAISLLVLMTARRIRKSFLARRMFRDALGKGVRRSPWRRRGQRDNVCDVATARWLFGVFTACAPLDVVATYIAGQR
jgi:hypothetical protein